MTKRNKLLLFLVISLTVFLFPKKSGEWLVVSEDAYHCKCLGFERVIGEPIDYKDNKPLFGKRVGSSICFGLPYSCKRAGDYYLFVY